MLCYPDGVMVENVMADGSVCDSLPAYLKSADQLPDLTKRLIVNFIHVGIMRSEKLLEAAAVHGEP